MKKKIISLTLIFILIITMIFCLYGCINSGGSYVVHGCISHTKDGSISAAYEYFDGLIFYRTRLKAGTTITLEATTKSGQMDIVISTKDLEHVWSQNFVSTGTLEINIETANLYTITITAHDHVGSYKFTW